MKRWVVKDKCSDKFLRLRGWLHQRPEWTSLLSEATIFGNGSYTSPRGDEELIGYLAKFPSARLMVVDYVVVREEEIAR